MARWDNVIAQWEKLLGINNTAWQWDSPQDIINQSVQNTGEILKNALPQNAQSIDKSVTDVLSQYNIPQQPMAQVPTPEQSGWFLDTVGNAIKNFGNNTIIGEAANTALSPLSSILPQWLTPLNLLWNTLSEIPTTKKELSSLYNDIRTGFSYLWSETQRAFDEAEVNKKYLGPMNDVLFVSDETLKTIDNEVNKVKSGQTTEEEALKKINDTRWFLGGSFSRVDDAQSYLSDISSIRSKAPNVTDYSTPQQKAEQESINKYSQQLSSRDKILSDSTNEWITGLKMRWFTGDILAAEDQMTAMRDTFTKELQYLYNAQATERAAMIKNWASQEEIDKKQAEWNTIGNIVRDRYGSLIRIAGSSYSPDKTELWENLKDIIHSQGYDSVSEYILKWVEDPNAKVAMSLSNLVDLKQSENQLDSLSLDDASLVSLFKWVTNAWSLWFSLLKSGIRKGQSEAGSELVAAWLGSVGDVDLQGWFFDKSRWTSIGEFVPYIPEIYLAVAGGWGAVARWERTIAQANSLISKWGALRKAYWYSKLWLGYATKFVGSTQQVISGEKWLNGVKASTAWGRTRLNFAKNAVPTILKEWNQGIRISSLIDSFTSDAYSDEDAMLDIAFSAIDVLQWVNAARKVGGVTDLLNSWYLKWVSNDLTIEEVPQLLAQMNVVKKSLDGSLDDALKTPESFNAFKTTWNAQNPENPINSIDDVNRKFKAAYARSQMGKIFNSDRDLVALWDMPTLRRIANYASELKNPNVNVADMMNADLLDNTSGLLSRVASNQQAVEPIRNVFWFIAKWVSPEDIRYNIEKWAINLTPWSLADEIWLDVKKYVEADVSELKAKLSEKSLNFDDYVAKVDDWKEWFYAIRPSKFQELGIEDTRSLFQKRADVIAETDSATGLYNMLRENGASETVINDLQQAWVYETIDDIFQGIIC